LAIGQIQYGNSNQPFPIVQWTCDQVLGLFSLNPKNQDAKSNALGSIISAAGAAAGAFFSLLGWFYTSIKDRVKKRNAMISSRRVFGSADDIRIMLEAYRRAVSVVVIGGDFSWLKRSTSQDNPEFTDICNRVEELASKGKIAIYSYKDQASIESAIGTQMFGRIATVTKFKSELEGIKASLVEDNFGKTLLYKVYSSEGMHIFHVSDKTPEGRMLLAQFTGLIKAI
jgi:hypothetical protein